MNRRAEGARHPEAHVTHDDDERILGTGRSTHTGQTERIVVTISVASKHPAADDSRRDLACAANDDDGVTPVVHLRGNQLLRS